MALALALALALTLTLTLALALTLILPSCGGTVAEDHSFGAVHGAAARLSEHSQLCRLDADGLCSAGLKTLQPPTY